jgi:beta-aspartyl-peptidase (threonine type)
VIKVQIKISKANCVTFGCMRYCFYFFLIAFVFTSCTKRTATTGVKSEPVQHAYALAIHGGAGAMPQGTYTPEQEDAYKQKLTEALKLGQLMLQNGDSAVDVIIAVIKILEDSPLFNAGKGSVFTFDGEIRMDASIMNGKTLDAGAVTNVSVVKNPITAANEVMKTKYILFSGAGADAFAEAKGCEIVDPFYFYTEHQFKRWMQTKDTLGIDKIRIDSLKNLQPVSYTDRYIVDKNYGTVGCVVLDKYGNLAAGTSTGGLMNKQFGRIGDSPIIGAGTYANNATCAVSCTGTGEDFIKTVAAKTVSDMMEYENYSVAQAVDSLLYKVFIPIKGDGGLIAVDYYGNVYMNYNSDGMFRASIDDTGNMFVGIYK